MLSWRRLPVPRCRCVQPPGGGRPAAADVSAGAPAHAAGVAPEPARGRRLLRGLHGAGGPACCSDLCHWCATALLASAGVQRQVPACAQSCTACVWGEFVPCWHLLASACMCAAARMHSYSSCSMWQHHTPPLMQHFRQALATHPTAPSPPDCSMLAGCTQGMLACNCLPHPAWLLQQPAP